MATPVPIRGGSANTARAVNRIAPGVAGGRRAGLAPVRNQVVSAPQAAPAAGGITVWEQADEPTEAAIHDFWWDTDATP